MMAPASASIDRLRQRFGERLQTAVRLARYTSARVGGPAEMLLVASSANDLAEMVSALWQMELPYLILGGGSNVLVSDAGVRGVVVLNRARQVRFRETGATPTVWAESGVNFGLLARQAALRGLSGLEWAAGIPGTLGGAVIGNAGAHGDEMAGNLVLAEILHHTGQKDGQRNFVIQREEWTKEEFEYAYRTSRLKANPGMAVVLAAKLYLVRSTREAVQRRVDELTEIRHRKQPPGASTGSMFKNPPGDHAGRLIEAAGLKGIQVGGVQISPLHANFFMNTGKGCARDFYRLICTAQQAVKQQFGIDLELEIQLIGDWSVAS